MRPKIFLLILMLAFCLGFSFPNMTAFASLGFSEEQEEWFNSQTANNQMEAKDNYNKAASELQEQYNEAVSEMQENFENGYASVVGEQEDEDADNYIEYYDDNDSEDQIDTSSVDESEEQFEIVEDAEGDAEEKTHDVTEIQNQSHRNILVIILCVVVCLAIVVFIILILSIKRKKR